MKVGILYICTGKYTVFWNEFYKGARSLLLPGHDKEFFVFTDAPAIRHERKADVHRIFQEKLIWPYPTLLRFHMFLRVERQLEGMDYLFFFNANTRIVTPIAPDELLPDPVKEDGLSAVLHSGYFNADSRTFPYERVQKRSRAYLERGRHYFQGGLNGGTRDAYLEMTRRLARDIQEDLDDHIIAAWHDESHLNKYLSDKNPKVLSPAYAYPEGAEFEFRPRVLLLDKAGFGGHAYMRGQKEGALEWMKAVTRKWRFAMTRMRR